MEVYWSRGQAGVRCRGDGRHAWLASSEDMKANIEVANYVAPRLIKYSVTIDFTYMYKSYRLSGFLRKLWVFHPNVSHSGRVALVAFLR